jgi:hypothetical protein
MEFRFALGAVETLWDGLAEASPPCATAECGWALNSRSRLDAVEYGASRLRWLALFWLASPGTAIRVCIPLHGGTLNKDCPEHRRIRPRKVGSPLIHCGKRDALR